MGYRFVWPTGIMLRPMTDVMSPAEAPPAQSRWARFPVWARIVAPVALILIVAAIVVAAVPRTFTVTGTMELIGASGDVYSPEEGDNHCSGASGYDDISGGDTQVIISDSSGTTVAVGHLATGHVASLGLGCTFKFTVQGVPSGKSFYKVEVSHRGSIQYTEGQLRKGIALSLG